MIVENLPPALLSQIEKSVCTFSDDSRLIYLISFNNNNVLEIMVFDVMYNKCVVLLPDKCITKLFDQMEDLKPQIQDLKPDVQTVDQNILLISFNEYFFKHFNGLTILTLVELNIKVRTFSLIDKMTFKDCYHGALFKDEFNFGLLHSFAVDKDEYDGNQFFGYHPLKIEDNKIILTKKDRIVFDFDYLIRQPSNIQLYGNKFWFLDEGPVTFRPRHEQRLPRPKDYIQLCYFDLNESNPKEIKVESIDVDDFGEPQWVKNEIVYYNEKTAEFSIFDLISKNWSRLPNNAELITYGNYNKNLIFFTMSPCLYGTARAYQLYIDRNYNATFIDKSTKQLQRVPLKNPIMLRDIAWTRALNYGMLDQHPQNLPKKLWYSKLF